MKKLIKEKIREIVEEIVDEKLSESSVNRAISFMDAHDVITMSAFRDRIKDITSMTKEEDKKRLKRMKIDGVEVLQSDPISKKENLSRNRDLRAALLANGYGITIISGNYVEGLGSKDLHEVGEQSLMVVNRHDKPDFIDVCAELAEYYNQDSILIIPKGTRTAYLYGTNNALYPGYHNKDNQGRLSVGLGSVFMSRVKNSPFAFVKDGTDSKGNPQLIRKKSAKDFSGDDADFLKHSYVWDDDRPSFQSRKAERIKKMQLEEYIRNLEGEIPILETINGSYKGFARQNVGTHGANIIEQIEKQKKNLK